MCDLAIIIPAYKPWFLEASLESIARQTNQNFHVYIGDDASPFDLEPIVRRFEHRIHLTYKKFETNFGGTDLVAQWERCIALSEEPWIWLFSDDDVMSPECVSEFYNARQLSHDTSCIYRINTWIMNKSETRVRDNFRTPERFSRADFATWLYLQQKLCCAVVEYIFPREIHRLSGGFISFPVAWHSDDATWFKFGKYADFHTLAGGEIGLRQSGENLSALTTNLDAKLKAEQLFADWMHSQTEDSLAQRIASQLGLLVYSNVGSVRVRKLLYQYIRLSQPKTIKEWVLASIHLAKISLRRSRHVASLWREKL